MSDFDTTEAKNKWYVDAFNKWKADNNIPPSIHHGKGSSGATQYNGQTYTQEELYQIFLKTNPPTPWTHPS